MTSSDAASFMSVREFVERAIVFERESAAFYEAMSEQCADNPTLLELLRLLAREELRHAGKLRQLKLEEPDAIIQFPPDLSSAMPPAPEQSPNLSQLIEIGILRERISRDMYLHAAETVTGRFRELLEGLARFEEEHEQRLTSMRGV